MRKSTRHLTRCVVAGIVALLPLGGAALTFFWLEGALGSLGVTRLPFYFPGLALLLAVVAVYLVGLLVTTIVGRWLWRRLDRTLETLPVLGAPYQSLKEVLGYDTGRERFFHGVVLVAGVTGDELGFVTGTCDDFGGSPRSIVFVPGSPNPANGRLLLVPTAELRRVSVRTGHAMRALVAMGKSPLVEDHSAAVSPATGSTRASPPE